MTTRVALVPGVLALLPEHAGLEDPVAEVRAACLRAVGWLGRDVRVVADEQGRRVADHLLAARGAPGEAAGESVLVVANGSATRSEQAPGHLDERAAGFDAALGAALCAGDLRGVDLSFAGDLWASVGALAELADLLDGTPATVDLDAAPFGVQYWVMRWTCGS